MSNSFFADLAKGIEAKAREHGYSMILFNSDHDPQRQQEYMDVVRRYRVDGIAAASHPDCVVVLMTNADDYENLTIRTGPCKVLDSVVTV